MLSLSYDDCTDAFPVTIMLLEQKGVARPSRNGPVLEYPEPVSVMFKYPQDRVLFHPVRTINPFLHFFEPLWIIAGRNDVAFLSNIVSRFKEYSDDGKTFFSAYGHRLRYPTDQISEAIRRFKNNPDDRQVVLQIRFPEDMLYRGVDTACNTAIAFKIRDGKLNAHVFNRSNDSIWGGPAGGANYPQFTTLMEYMAGHIGCKLGTYHQTTDNMHVYTDLPDWQKLRGLGTAVHNPYKYQEVMAYAMSACDNFDADLEKFFNDFTGPYETDYFNEVVDPMWRLFQRYKRKEMPMAFEFYDLKASDWKLGVERFFEKVFKKD